MADALMVLGTASNVGKSLVVAALCRHFARRGVRVAPFKAQNMSLNSAATPQGGEIGRAQALQAEAAGIAPSVDMNPVLLKPTSDGCSQVVVQGNPWRLCEARDYYRQDLRDALFERVLDSYARVSAAYDLVIIEGAGSPAEINLRERDIVNMTMAHAADASCLLVGDIDRGGVFASLLGTLELLDERDRARIRAFAVNKFRGDPTLLQPGIDAIVPRLGIPCAGVIPHIHDLRLDDEDSVVLEERVSSRGWSPNTALRIAVVALPYLSNFTDFEALAAEPSVELRYVRDPEQLTDAHVIVLPGTKTTIADLDWLRERGFHSALKAVLGRVTIVGICGGMQMLGESIDDPHNVEGGGRRDGLGFLPIATTLREEKVTRRVTGTLANVVTGTLGNVITGTLGNVIPSLSREITGYEIHAGETRYAPGCEPFAFIVREGEHAPVRDGAVSGDGRVIGSYLHGLFADDAFRHGFIAQMRLRAGLPPARDLVHVAAQREHEIDRLADVVAQSLDLSLLLESAIAP